MRARLSKFLGKDKIGIRKCLLNLFLQTKNYTTCEIYTHLRKQGFEIIPVSQMLADLEEDETAGELPDSEEAWEASK